MIKVIVPISGGKDSQACLKLALQEYDKSDVIGLFCDTRFEHPLTYQHIEKIRDLYGVHIETVCAGSVPEKIMALKNPMFPSGTARCCTDMLKIQPSKAFYKQFAEKQGGFEVWCGMRSAESNDRKKRYEGKVSTELYAPNDVMKNYPKYFHKKLNIWFRLPVLDLTTQQIFDILGGERNELYNQGFDRVGCFPCLASGDYWKEKAFNHDETGAKHYEIVKEIERKTGKSVWTSKGGAIRNNENQGDLFEGCSFCAI